MTRKRQPSAVDDRSMTIVATREVVCSAGINHTAIKRDDKMWQTLVFVGVQHVEASGDEPAYTIELRDCPCGSTLGRVAKTVEPETKIASC